MSKFLPFISDTSSNIAVFKAIVQRSKGMSNTQIASVYTAILRDGITEVRRVADKAASQNSSANGAFAAVATHFSSMSPVESFIDYVGYLLLFFNVKIEELRPFDKNHVALMVASLAHEGLSKTWNDYEIPFPIDGVVSSFKNKESAELSGVPKVSITTDGTKVGFHSYIELYAFLWYLSGNDVKCGVYPVRLSKEKPVDYMFPPEKYAEKSVTAPIDFIRGENAS